MHETLDLLIAKFRAAQDVGVATLVHDLQIPQPKSGVEWVQYCSTRGLYNTKELQGIGIYAHGYGIELKIGSMTIDFDWGSNGEPDGFDSWRLYNFSLDNLPSVENTHSVVNDWLDAALADGELIKVGSLYYDIKRLRGLSRPQYRLRVAEEIRVFYDVPEDTVEVLAIVPKSEANEWLERYGESDEESGSE